MPVRKDNPRYNIVSTRLDDHLRAEVTTWLDGRSLSDYLHAAIEEKVARDRQHEGPVMDKVPGLTRHCETLLSNRECPYIELGCKGCMFKMDKIDREKTR